MSGSILLNYGIHLNLAKSNAKYLIVINPPVDLKLASLTLSKGFNKIYDYRFYIKLKNLIYNMKPNFNWPFYLKIFDFDNQITAKMYGFKDALDYYEKCSTVNSLNKLKIKFIFKLILKQKLIAGFSIVKRSSLDQALRRIHRRVPRKMVVIDHGYSNYSVKFEEENYNKNKKK